MGVEFTGDWDRLRRVLDRVAKQFKGEIAKETGRSLKRIERRVLSHVDNQDLNWEPLSKQYAKKKEKRGDSPDILRASNRMYESITTYQEDAWSGMVGVKRGIKNDDGEEVTDIALIHEAPHAQGPYSTIGSRVTVVPRKLWQPTFEEMKEEIAGDIMGATIRIFKK